MGGGHHIMAWPWGAKPLFSFNVLSAAFILPPRIRATQLRAGGSIFGLRRWEKNQVDNHSYAKSSAAAAVLPLISY